MKTKMSPVMALGHPVVAIDESPDDRTWLRAIPVGAIPVGEIAAS